MGLLDRIFRRKDKNIGLPAGRENIQDVNDVPVEEQDQAKKAEVKVFSRSDENGGITYEIKLDTGEKMESLGTIHNDVKDEGIESTSQKLSLLQMRKEVEGMAQSLQDCKKNPHTLSKEKKRIIEKLKDMESKYPQLSWSGAMDYVENYGTEEITKLKGLPKKIDISKLSKEEIKKYGAMLEVGLKRLGSIQTADDTMIPENREFLEAYMKQKEADVPDNPIVSAYRESLEKGTNLDEETVLQIAQKMKLGNEDNALYPTYLHKKEGQVLRQLYRTMGEYMIRNSAGDKAVMKRNLEMIYYIKEEIEGIQGGFSSELLETVMNSVNREDIPIYMKEYKQKDMALVREINKNYSDMPEPDRTNILTFLNARIGSLGQLSYKGDSYNTRTLRDFVANTDFKDKDDTEVKNFLLIVARTAEKDIHQQFDPLLDKNRENKPFKERIHDSANVGENDFGQPARVIEPEAFKERELDDGERTA